MKKKKRKIHHSIRGSTRSNPKTAGNGCSEKIKGPGSIVARFIGCYFTSISFFTFRNLSVRNS